MILLGLLIFIFRASFLQWLSGFLASLLLLFAFLHLSRKLLINQQMSKPKDLLELLLEGGVSLCLAYFLANYPGMSINFIGDLLGGYLILLAIISTISSVLLWRDNSPAQYWRTFYAILHFLLGFLALNFNPDGPWLLLAFSFYLVSLGITFISDGWGAIFFDVTGASFRRHLRFSIPIVFHAHLPRRLLNRLAKTYATPTNPILAEANQVGVNSEAILQLIFSTSPQQFDLLGHINFGYQGKIYNYGNYDIDSRHLFDSVGEGVLAVCQRQKFLAFYLERGQTLIEYDIPLNSRQVQRLDAAIAHLMVDVKPFIPESPSQRASHGGQLFLQTGAQMYKFTRGRFQTYFVFGSNCVLLVDNIIGQLGIDRFAMLGILTPGTYFDFFEKEYQKVPSWISARHLYQKSSEVGNNRLVQQLPEENIT